MKTLEIIIFGVLLIILFLVYYKLIKYNNNHTITNLENKTWNIEDKNYNRHNKTWNFNEAVCEYLNIQLKSNDTYTSKYNIGINYNIIKPNKILNAIKEYKLNTINILDNGNAVYIKSEKDVNKIKEEILTLKNPMYDQIFIIVKCEAREAFYVPLKILEDYIKSDIAYSYSIREFLKILEWNNNDNKKENNKLGTLCVAYVNLMTYEYIKLMLN